MMQPLWSAFQSIFLRDFSTSTFVPALNQEQPILLSRMQALRNIAIIAHVDHGKTTLVDKIIHQAKLFRDNQETRELIMDNNDLERERGITIFSKNFAIRYKDTKINIIDTPGHADFGGEVERVLKMADGVILLVDAFEGPMPQTRFVTSKALELGLKPIVVVNKVDKPNCTPDEVHEQVFDLFFQLEATEEQLDFPTYYGSGKHGWFSSDWKKPTDDITELVDGILEHVPEPVADPEGPVQMQVTSLDFSSYKGRIAIGKVQRGTLRKGQSVMLIDRDGHQSRSKIQELFLFDGLGRTPAEEAHASDICAVVGVEGFQIGDTLSDVAHPEPLPAIKIDQPTMSMSFSVNDSPFFGKEGDFVTSRQIRDRLYAETERNLALRIEETDSPDRFLVYGRGVMHLSVLIETMRREGYEMQVGQPQVLIQYDEDGKKREPIENLVVNVPAELGGKVIELATGRKGELQSITDKGETQTITFNIPSRGIIGLRNQLLTATSGEAVMAHRFEHYDAWKGPIGTRSSGVLVALETGQVKSYALEKLQDRGTFFVESGEQVYHGQIVGQHIRNEDLSVNLTKAKHLNNMRASGKDKTTGIAPKRIFSLEEALEYIQNDEWVEVTPKSLRMRKIELDDEKRKRTAKQQAAALS